MGEQSKQSGQFINNKVDLRKLPDPCPERQITTGEQATIGDLHGNAMKLVYFLISEGVLQLKDRNTGKTQDALYKELYEIYTTGMVEPRNSWMDGTGIPFSTPSPEGIARFKEILSEAVIPEHAKGSLVRLIGDDLADRGGNDFLTLLVMNKIIDSKDVSLNVLISNHGAWGMEIYDSVVNSRDYEDFKEKYFRKYREKFPHGQKGTEKAKLASANIGSCAGCYCQLSSMHGLFALLEKAPNLFEDVKRAYQKYRTRLKLIDYSIGDDGELSIYTHAPIDFSDIQKVAEYFGIMKENAPFPESLEDRLTLIDAINSKSTEFSDIYSPRYTKSETMQQAGFDEQTAAYRFIWMRREQHPKYFVLESEQFIHGHDGKGKSPDGLRNLDENVGKLSFCSGELPIYRNRGIGPGCTAKDREVAVKRYKNNQDEKRELLSTPDEFYATLEDQEMEWGRTKKYEIVKDLLPGRIQSHTDFMFVVALLNTEQCKEVCDALGNRLPEVIPTKDIFDMIIDFVEEEPKQIIIAKAIIQNIRGQEHAALKKDMEDFLKAKEIPRVTPMAQDLSEKIYTAQKFFVLLINTKINDYEKKHEAQGLYTIMKDRLPGMINNMNDFRMVIKCLDEQQRRELYMAVKDKLPEKVGKYNDVISMLFAIGYGEEGAALRRELYKNVQDKFPELIKKVEHFESIIKNIKEPEKSEVAKSIISSLNRSTESSKEIAKEICLKYPQYSHDTEDKQDKSNSRPRM